MNGDRRATAAGIAGEIAARIRTGELGPGARAPSTREIMRRWGVAMATASKVLALLRDEGLVQTRRGAGSVVVGPIRRLAPGTGRRPGGQALSTRRIVSAAIAVADREGLGALSMRRVAVELDVATMSLYRHVRDKDALLALMVDETFRLQRTRSTTSPDWQVGLKAETRAQWQTFRAHPWLASALSISRPTPLPSGMAYSDRVLRLLLTAGFTADQAFSLHLVLLNLLRGFATTVEAESASEVDSGLTADEWMDTQRAALEDAMAGQDLPALRRVMSELEPGGYDYDLDHLFTLGLELVLAGIAARTSHPDPGSRHR